MKIFITGATGVLGRQSVPQLVQSGHQVRGLARSDGNVELLRRLREEPARVDLFDVDHSKTGANCLLDGE